MICKRPYVKDGIPFGCGQCIGCRIKKRQEWTHRLILETTQHNENAFITLTYKDVPLCGSVCPSHLRNFLKRLRKALTNDEKPEKTRLIRFYAVAEYGGKFDRPHYHLAIFNYPSCSDISRKIYLRFKGKSCDCPNCSLIAKAWGKGMISNDELSVASAGYVAGYITKKVANFDDPAARGLLPSFTRMSNRPGIGKTALHKLIEYLRSPAGQKLIQATGDVPPLLKHGKKKYPLGRYLRSELRKALNIESIEVDQHGVIINEKPAGSCPVEIINQLKNKVLHEFYEAYMHSVKDPSGYWSHFLSKKTETRKQQFINLETKFKLWSSKR